MPPAARMGDTMSHGGTIVVGFPMVLIGGQPAAHVGDMHVCPMFNGWYRMLVGRSYLPAARPS